MQSLLPKAGQTVQRLRSAIKIPPSVKEVGQISGATLVGITTVGTAAIAGGLVGLQISFRHLPDVRILKNYVPAETTYIYDIDGDLLTSLHDEANREIVGLNEISPDLKRAILAVEDSRFYSHPGINISSIARAFLSNLQEGETVEGGSTLTMQLVKNLFLTPERSLSRKAAEAILSLRLEQVFTKNQILEMYLNQVYWGHNTYGVEAAAQSYFGKSSTDLSLAESAMLAGLIQAPERYSPFVDYEQAKDRQITALDRMLALKWITAEERATAIKTPIQLGEIQSFRTSKVPYVTDAVVQEVTEKFGRGALLKGGMRIQTTVDLRLQRLAEAVVQQGQANLQARGLYADQVALVAIDPRTHFVKAIVGGVNYDTNQYNRATQAKRQPGSAFKPFVYYAAFASGQYQPGSIVTDVPITYPGGAKPYSPQNYDGTFWGPITARTALENSRNIPAIKLGQEVGLSTVIEVSRRLGIKSHMEPVAPLAIGAVDLTPLEITGAYASFASGGWHSPPTLVAQITDSTGQVLIDNTPEPHLVLDPQAVAALNDVLQGVITQGSGTAAQLDRPAAGKTGTTDSARDIWFVGYVPQLATGVWVGNDDYHPIGYNVTGGSHAAPIWREFMSQALRREPVEHFRPARTLPPPRSSTPRSSAPASAPRSSRQPLSQPAPSTAPSESSPPLTGPPSGALPTVPPPREAKEPEPAAKD